MREYKKYFKYSRKMSEIGESLIVDKTLTERQKLAKIIQLQEILNFIDNEISRMSDGIPSEMILMMRILKTKEYPKFNKTDWQIFCDSIPEDDYEFKKIKNRMIKYLSESDGKTNVFIMSRLYRVKISYYKRIIVLKSKKTK